MGVVIDAQGQNARVAALPFHVVEQRLDEYPPDVDATLHGRISTPHLRGRLHDEPEFGDLVLEAEAVKT
jgi:hypothetical protein